MTTEYKDIRVDVEGLFATLHALRLPFAWRFHWTDALLVTVAAPERRCVLHLGIDITNGKVIYCSTKEYREGEDDE